MRPFAAASVQISGPDALLPVRSCPPAGAGPTPGYQHCDGGIGLRPAGGRGLPDSPAAPRLLCGRGGATSCAGVKDAVLTPTARAAGLSGGLHLQPSAGRPVSLLCLGQAHPRQRSRRVGAELLQPVPYNGVLELRQAIAGHLRQFRGLQTDPSCSWWALARSISITC